MGGLIRSISRIHMEWRVLITDGLSPSGLELLESQAEVVHSEGLDGLGEVDAMIVRGRTKATAAVLNAGSPRLRVVGRAGVGVDNIDLDTARELGIIVVNAPEATSHAVAELTLGLMLSLARQIPRADASLRSQNWLKKELVGVQLQGKVLGIIGVGRVGSEVAKRASALGMRILGFDIAVTPESLREQGIEPVGLDELLAQGDFISLHVPLTEGTRNMIGAQELRQVKPEAYLVTTARGGVVDEGAVLEALHEGRLAGAALDVFDQEPPGSNPLIQHPCVIVTPHIGAQTREAQEKAGLDIAQEVIAALNDEPLRWRVA